MSTDSIVFGAAGFIGRSLVAELLGRGNHVAAALRPGSAERLAEWLDAQGIDTMRLTIVTCDITEPDLGLPASGLEEVRDVYNSAGAYAWGLTTEEAKRVNVTGALNVLDWAAGLPSLRRVVHITGYRAALKNSEAWHYENGGYEASKAEADAALLARAKAESIPLTFANPSTVIGPGQYIGLASVVADLWRGKLPALPGDPNTFVPVVSVGYFTQFLATLPLRAETVGNSYTVLDEATPNLPDLVRLLATHLGVGAPRLLLPVGVIRRLPRALTGVEPETLTFLADDRYDTASADAHARDMGLRMPPVDQALRDWADHLVASRFGTVHPAEPSGFHEGTWVMGHREHPDYVLLHGLPIDSDAWADVTAELGPATLRADLPGLGRSAPSPKPMAEWLDDLMRPVTTRPVLVAHSLACDPAISFALAHPDRISRLVLVAPAFLQARAGWLMRSSLAAPTMRRALTSRLATLLGVPDGPAVASAVANLHRPGVAKRTVAALRTASAPHRRAALRERLARVTVPVDIIIGSDDPLTEVTDRPVTVIAGTGHFPQISHPAEVARALTPAYRS
ncbi:MAG: alpha/beta fold hydrolase [Sphaerisporangium sp.]|nr:alpha/beta fold hydrolase [Sphaerisporangium sp.]